MNRRRFLGSVGAAGLALAGVARPAAGSRPPGSGGTDPADVEATVVRTDAQSYAEILAGGSSRWYQPDLFAPVSYTGTDEVHTDAIYSFTIDGRVAPFHGFGSRQTILRLPNGTIVRDSTLSGGSVGTHYVWHVQGTTLALRFDTWTGTRDEVLEIVYDPNYDVFDVSHPGYGSGTWYRMPV